MFVQLFMSRPLIPILHRSIQIKTRRHIHYNMIMGGSSQSQLADSRRMPCKAVLSLRDFVRKIRGSLPIWYP